MYPVSEPLCGCCSISHYLEAEIYKNLYATLNYSPSLSIKGDINQTLLEKEIIHFMAYDALMTFGPSCKETDRNDAA